MSGGGSEGSRPTPAPAHGRFYTYVLNNIDVVITIIYSQKYVHGIYRARLDVERLRLAATDSLRPLG